VAKCIHSPIPASSTDPARLIEEGRYAEAAALLEEKTGDELSRNRNIVLLARAYADHGDFNRALRWCERGIVSNRLNPALHYLHAIILGERGDDKAGREALRKTLCLDPDFILASIALGSAEQKSGRVEEAARYFENARSLLRNLREDVAVPESGGLTAGRLREILMHTGGAGS
jgi:chemotaxis protein methyltransferase CheR